MDSLYIQEIKHRRAEWAAALTSGDYLQGRNALGRTTGEFCCLGVACEVFAKELDIIRISPPSAIGHYAYRIGEDGYGTLSLPEPLRLYLGLTSSAQTMLMHLNDSGTSFEVIAGILQYLEIEEPQE